MKILNIINVFFLSILTLRCTVAPPRPFTEADCKELSGKIIMGTGDVAQRVKRFSEIAQVSPGCFRGDMGSFYSHFLDEAFTQAPKLKSEYQDRVSSVLFPSQSIEQNVKGFPLAKNGLPSYDFEFDALWARFFVKRDTKFLNQVARGLLTAVSRNPFMSEFNRVQIMSGAWSVWSNIRQSEDVKNYFWGLKVKSEEKELLSHILAQTKNENWNAQEFVSLLQEEVRKMAVSENKLKVFHTQLVNYSLLSPVHAYHTKIDVEIQSYENFYNLEILIGGLFTKFNANGKSLTVDSRKINGDLVTQELKLGNLLLTFTYNRAKSPTKTAKLTVNNLVLAIEDQSTRGKESP